MSFFGVTGTPVLDYLVKVSCWVSKPRVGSALFANFFKLLATF